MRHCVKDTLRDRLFEQAIDLQDMRNSNTLFFLMLFGISFFPSISGSEERWKDAEKTVITTKEIKKMNVRSIVELLNQIPGVSAGESSVSLRGSYMVRVFIDGRSINDPLSGHRSIRWGAINLDNIEKVEIYKGGGAILFGDDSSGGVINIKTKEIKGSKGNIEIFGGNLNSQSYSLNYQQDIGASSTSSDVETSSGSRPLGIGFSAGWDRSDGFRTNNDKDKKRVGTKIGYKPSKRYSFDLSLDYSEEDRGIPGLPAFPTPRARTESNAFGSSLQCRVGRLGSGTHFSTFEKEHSNPERDLVTRLESWSIKEELKSPLPMGRYGLIDTGLNLEIAQVEGNKIESHQEEKYGVYASKEVCPGFLPIKLGLGLRWNLYSEFDHSLNPEFRVGFDRDSFSIRFSVQKTNNTPTFVQRYYESTTTIPNPDLGMEKAMNYSVTLSYNPKRLFEGDVSFFFNRVEDRITYVRGDEGIGRYDNLGKVTLKGADCSLKWRPSDFLEIRPSYVYLSTKDELTGNRLACKPEHKIKFDIQYKPLTNLTLGLNTRYLSRQYTRSNNKESVPGYFLVDLRGDYYLKSWRLFLKVENLFDKDYYYGDGYPAPPLTWIAGLDYKL